MSYPNRGLFSYTPTQQFKADDIGYFAAEAKRNAAEQQKAIGTATAQAAAKSAKPALELTKVEKSPELSSAFKDLLSPLQSLAKSQADATKTLQEQQAMVNPRFQSAMLEDVGRVTSDLGSYEKTLAALDREGRAALDAREAEAQREALGVLERYGAGRPAMGMGSELGKIAADRVAAARLPYALQVTQFSADIADRLARARAGTVGQRQNLLSSGYGFLRSQADDAMRPLSSALNLVGQAGDVFSRLNFLGVGGETGQNPYSLPVFAQRLPVPTVRYPQPYVPPAPVSQAMSTGTPLTVPMTRRGANLYESEEEYYARLDRERAALADARARAARAWERRSEAEYPQFAEENAFFAQPEYPQFAEENAFFARA